MNMNENINEKNEVMNEETELTVYEDDFDLVTAEEEESKSASKLKGVCTVVGAATLVVGAVAGAKKLVSRHKSKKLAKEEQIREEAREETKRELIAEGWMPPVTEESVDVEEVEETTED